MSRQNPILDSFFHDEKKKKKLEKLVERYYGKLDLLKAWEARDDIDPKYIRDLKAKLRTYKNDLTYRGYDEEE